MIQIFPNIDFFQKSPYGQNALIPRKILWQGIHTCIDAYCQESDQSVVVDLPVGHAVTFPCIVNPLKKEIFCAPEIKKWLGNVLLRSLNEPNDQHVSIKIEIFKECSTVVILNCIDNYYGHSLLKLFNAERHLDKNNECGLIVIVQNNFRWLVPDDVAEIWTVDIPLSQASNCYPSLDEQIQNQCRRFSKIFVSKAYSHPTILQITRFTRIKPHDLTQKEFRITFVWRNDRPWMNNIYIVEVFKRTRLLHLLLLLQNRKITKLFSTLRKIFPRARYTVIGLGIQTSFPEWIEDQRVKIFSTDTENMMCKIYSESRVIIGVHGSNMLLPSAHAGMTVDLMPTDRWSNFAQDIVFQERDIRLSSFRYRFFPISTSIKILAKVIMSMIEEFNFFKQQMLH